MEDLKIFQSDTREKWGHQEMQEDTINRDVNYVESSLYCSATDSITCSALRYRMSQTIGAEV